MINYITGKLLSFITEKGAIDGSNTEVVEFYQYGIEVSVSSLLSVVIILILSFVCRHPIEGLIFLAVMIPTRQFTGGYHADSYLVCNIVFAACFVVMLAACRFLGDIPYMMSILLLVTEMLFVLSYCPIQNRHKPVTEKKQIVRCKVVSGVLFALFGGVGIALNMLCIAYGSAFLYSLHLVMVLGIIGIIKERRSSCEEAVQGS